MAKLKIAIYAGHYNYWGDVSPKRLKGRGVGQLGGGETAALYTAMHLAEKHDVWLGVNTAQGRQDGNLRIVPTGRGDFGGQLVYDLHPDIVIGWDSPWLFRFTLHGSKHIVAYQLNDTNILGLDYNIDAYFHPSSWHVERFVETYGLPRHKCVPLMTNAVNRQLYSLVVPPPKRQPRVIYCSSPDRGLHHLLRMWPAVRAAVPEAELHIYYDMDKWLGVVANAEAQGMQVNTADRAHEVQRLLRAQLDNGVVYHGGVSKLELADAQLAGAVLAYTCDPIAPTEGYSMTILEGWAAGLQVVTTDADALPELWGDKPGITILPLPVDDGTWVDVLVNRLHTIPQPGYNKELPDDYTWKRLAQRWEQFFAQILE